MKRVVEIFGRTKSNPAVQCANEESDVWGFDTEKSQLEDKMEEIEYLRTHELSLERVVHVAKSGLSNIKRRSIKLGGNLIDSTVPDIIRKLPIRIERVMQIDREEFGTLERMRLTQNQNQSPITSGKDFVTCDTSNKGNQFRKGSAKDQKVSWLLDFRKRENEAYLRRMKEKNAEEKRQKEEEKLFEYEQTCKIEINRLKNAKDFWSRQAKQYRSEIREPFVEGMECREVHIKGDSSLSLSTSLLLQNKESTKEHQLYEYPSGIFSQRQDGSIEYIK